MLIKLFTLVISTAVPSRYCTHSLPLVLVAYFIANICEELCDTGITQVVKQWGFGAGSGFRRRRIDGKIGIVRQIQIL